MSVGNIKEASEKVLMLKAAESGEIGLCRGTCATHGRALGLKRSKFGKVGHLEEMELILKETGHREVGGRCIFWRKTT